LFVVEARSEFGQSITRRRPAPGSQTGSAARLSANLLSALALILGVLTILGLLLALGRKGYDDPYITFRYARNLLAGNGFVYNAGQRTLSTTAPLYALLLAGLGLAWPDLPSLSNALSALSLLLAGLFLWSLARGRGERATSLIAALLLILSPHLIVTFGAETCLYLALILAGFLAYDRGWLNLCAGVMALAAMVRPDALLAALALGSYHLARRRPITWQPVALYISLLAGWIVGLWLYFGSPIPVTLAAKQHQARMASSQLFEAGFLTFIRNQGRLPLYWLHAALALLGLARVIGRARHWLPLLLWTALYFLAYTLLGVSSYFWYYAPLVPAFAILVAEGLASLATIVGTRLPRPAVMVLAGLLLVALLAPLLAGTLQTGWQDDPRAGAYQELGHWLAANTPPGATIGALEVGIIGYYADRTMIGFAGLVQPEVARHLEAGTTYQDAAAWTIRAYQPDYVTLHRPAFATLATSDWFLDRYQPVHDLGNGQALWLTLYRRRMGP
jgi:hypothetical protein